MAKDLLHIPIPVNMCAEKITNMNDGSEPMDAVNFRQLAQAIGLLPGGTTDQVLAKNSNTNFDLKWMSLPTVITLTKVADVTLTQGNWSLNAGYYEYTLSNANITASSKVDIEPLKAYTDIVKAAEIEPEVIPGSGTVMLFAKNAPTGDIHVNLEIIK